MGEHSSVQATDAFGEAARKVANGGDPLEEASRLVGQMTLDERLGCLDGDTPFWPGLVDMASGGYHEHPWPAAAVERLGIPGIAFADGPRGCVVGNATAFPVSMARGASFDAALEERIGRAIGAELRASGATLTGAVCMNLLRHPAWGRAQETYGEDPYHVGTMAEALTRGLQCHVLACMKHFALNSMENARFRVDVSVDDRALHEVYLPHFRRVAAAGVAAVMSAYNSVNGAWCGENRVLLTEILRDEWGWDGFVVTDFVFGLRDAPGSVRAGLDIEMPFRQQRATTLPGAIVAGELDEADVDRAVERVVATLLRFHHLLDAQPPPEVISCAEHRALAREASSASMVLLKNDRRLLPIDPGQVQRVAVLGRLAQVANLGDGGSSDVHASPVVTPLMGLKSSFAAAEVVHSDDDAHLAASADLAVVVVGCTKHDEGEYIDAAATMALVQQLAPPIDHPDFGVNAAISTVTGTTITSTSTTPSTTPSNSNNAGRAAEARTGGPSLGDTPGGDRATLRLSAADEALIASTVAVNPRTVVCVMGGSAVVMPWADSAPAVLMIWYPGVEGGAALGDVITGVVEPGGRLPFAIPTDETHLVDFDREAVEATYGLFHGQWHLDREGHRAHFPFGWGMGYASWRIDAAVVDDHGTAVSVEVANTGDRSGSTVVFVHAGMPVSRWERPLRRLIGFAKVRADAGAVVTAQIPLDPAMLDVRDDGRWHREPGVINLEVGAWAGDPGAVPIQMLR
jgi:beta-glucosidase